MVISKIRNLTTLLVLPLGVLLSSVATARPRLGITGSYVAQGLWSGAVSDVSGTTWHVRLGARQAKLFRLRSGSTSRVGPINST